MGPSCSSERQTFSKPRGKCVFTMLLLLQSRFSHIRLCVTPWTMAFQASLSMGFSRQEYWNGLPCPPPEDLPGTEPVSLMSPALACRFFTIGATWGALYLQERHKIIAIIPMSKLKRSSGKSTVDTRNWCKFIGLPCFRACGCCRSCLTTCTN